MDNKVIRALGAKFTFTIANGHSAQYVVALLAAFFNTFKLTLAEGTPNTATIAFSNAAEITAAGYSCDAVLDDGTIATSLVCTAGNSKRTIRQFREYVKQNGLILDSLEVQANNAAAFNQTIEVVDYSPVQGSAPQEFALSAFKGVYQSATDKVVIPNLDMQLNQNTLMMIPVAAGHTMTFTMNFK